VILPLLKVVKFEDCQFSRQQSATQVGLPKRPGPAYRGGRRHPVSGVVPETARRSTSFLHARPKRFAPLTRRMPAASSGLKRPVSEASYASRRTAAKRTLIVEGAKFFCSKKNR